MVMMSILATAILFTPQVSGGAQGSPTPTFGGQQRTPARDATLEKKGTALIRLPWRRVPTVNNNQ